MGKLQGLALLREGHDPIKTYSAYNVLIFRERSFSTRAQMLSTTFDPENRLVARGLESEWENRLRDLAAAESELRRREQGEISPGKVQNLSPRAAWLYSMRLDEVWALLFPASSPPAHGPHRQFLSLRSKVCSPLLSASPRGYALRLATVTFSGSG